MSTGKRRAARAQQDRVDRIIAEWREERPDLAVSPVAIIGRLGRLMLYIDDALESVFAEHGISRASWDVLAALRRVGAPYKLGQSELLAALMRTSGTVSLRIDRLEQDGLVQREPAPDDRRSVFVSLTPKGVHLFDRVAPMHLANEAQLIEALSNGEQTELAGLLRKLLLSFENSEGSRPERRLGIAVHSRAETIRLRRAVGLPERSGVLIKGVFKDGAAERAGLAQGDLIVRIGKTEITSWAQLQRAILRTPAPRFTLCVIRGIRERTVTVTVTV
jgi:DNA-binding MarR family transcriptional regulator